MTDEVDQSGPDDIDARFASNMQIRRELDGISQADLIKKLKESGWENVHQTTISRIEKGERPARLGEARAIARALNVNLSQLMLTPGESELAGRISWQRQRVVDARSSITAAATNFYDERFILEKLVADIQESGVVPTPIPESDDWATLVSSGSAEDELALAIVALESNPASAINLGRLLSRGKRGPIVVPGLNARDDAEA